MSLPLPLRSFVAIGLLSSILPSVHAQSLTVTGTTTLPEDTIATYTSITVQSGGTLEIGGGSVITVTGALTINDGGTVLCRSKNVDAQVDGAWAGVGVTLQAGSVSIAATGLLSADGQGYRNGIGPGFPTGLGANIAYRTGASHGGAGTGAGAIAGYGSGFEPTTPGQGAAFFDDEQTAGGGAIRLIVNGTLTLNGEISADGTGTPAASGTFHGGATGGSIWVTVGALTGAGRFSADGYTSVYNTAVTSYGWSSGGRIAVYAGSAAGFTGFETSTTNAGGGTAQVGSVVYAVGAPGAQAMRIPTHASFPQDLELSLESLLVQNDATLSLGGGTLLTISGALTLGDNATLVCEGKNLTEQVDGAWAGTGVTIAAATVTVPATAKISADGEGYRNAVGPGMAPTLVPTSLEARRAGASHGGAGTGGSTNQPVVPVYGSSLQPTTPGQGAGGAATDVVAGGGVIRLIVAGTLTLDGTITANGVSVGTARGGATGGSIWVTTGTLTGSGRFAADAVTGTGTALGYSGGGRIAVYYGANGGFSGFLTSTVSASNVAGQLGTLAFVNTSVAGGGALRVPQRMTLDDGPVFSAGSLTVENGATLSVASGVALKIAGALTVTGNSTLQLASADVLAAVDGAWIGTGARIEADSVIVSAGSRISVDGEGYRNGVGPGMSPTLVPTSLEARRAGASHGGAGTGGSTNQPVVPVYGSSLQPTTPGQGAGGAATDVVAGGGALRLIVDDTLTLDGTITANGVSTGTARGGATGGSIWVTAGILTGSGRFAADAVAGTGTALGHSGGGRIAVYYQSDAGFGGFETSTANASHVDGNAGTIFFMGTSVEGGAMRVYQRMTLDDGPVYSLGSLTLGNGATVEVAGGVALDIAGALSISDNSTLHLRSINHLAPTSAGWIGSGGVIVAGDITVAAGSKISADGEGYRNGNGPGFPIGLPDASAYRTGASYGGRGTGTGPLATFGRPLEPVILGTGAAVSVGDNEATAGGGALRIIVEGTLTLEGEISADGVATSPGFQVAHGGATGGSIWVTTNVLAGSGRFTADATPAVFINGNPSTGHSGGGRIAVYYQEEDGFGGFATSTAAADIGDAQPGSVIFIRTAGGLLDAHCFTRIDALDTHEIELDGFTLEPGAVLDLFGGSTLRVTGLVDIKENAVVNFLGKNRTTAFGDAWFGEGARIDAGDLRVAASAVLTADGQGYLDGAGPGGPNAEIANIGASYGGRGSGANARDPYGSLVAPRDLGSAGGYNRNATHTRTSTAGGGAIFLSIKNALELDGFITATGRTIDTTHAGATGGSVLIRADSISGAGRIDASGIVGSGNNNSSGGRIAIWANANAIPANLITAAAGGPGAAAGTIHYAEPDEIVWITTLDEVFSGSTRLEWITTGGGGSSIGVELVAQPSLGAPVTLATELAADGDFVWDTTAVPDGVYTLTVRKRNTDTDQILGSDTRTVTVINDNLVLRGTLTEDVTLPAGEVTYVIGEVIIPGGVTVTAEPGAIVKVALGGSFVAEEGGTLIARGTEAEPIVFTSLLDDTVGGDSNHDGAATAPGVADWNGLRSTGGTYDFNEHAEVRHAVEVVSGEITTTVRWRAGSLHLIERDLHVLLGGSLTIEAGAIVKFAPDTGLFVTNGTLVTEGTELRPVIFTSARDDTRGGDSNNDGSLTSPQAGDWYGILFNETTSSLRHTHFYYGGASWAGFRSMFDVRAATVRFESCAFVDALFEVVYLQPDRGGSVTLENCLFSRANRGVRAFRGSTAVVRNCVFDSVRFALHYAGGRIDVYNTAITNSIDWGVFVDGGSVITDFVANAFWNPKASGGNSSDPAIVVGQNGVIEGDPRFVNRAVGDFRVLAGSVLIDAGQAASATATDHRGFARLGTAPEIGAFEFTEPYASPVDLQAEISTAPATALSGGPVELSITASNSGTASAKGPWRHAVFLRPLDGGADIPVAELVDEPDAVLAPAGTATFATTVQVPEGLIGLHAWGVTVNPREGIFEGANLANNTAVAATPTLLDVPELPFDGSVSGRFFRAGESRVYKVRPPEPGQTIHLLADTDATRGFTQILVARGRVPAVDDFDAQSPQWSTPDATLSIPNSADDWYYVRVVATEMRIPTAAFTLAAQSVEFQLTGLGLNVVGTGKVTIPVLGTDLRNGASVTLRPTGGTGSINSQNVTVTGGTSADAAFDLTDVAPGTYDVIVTQNGVERVLPGKLRISSAAAGAKIITTVAGPGTNRVGFPYFAAITTRNVGAADAITPIITVTGPGLPVDLDDPTNPFYGYGFGSSGDSGRDFFFAIPPTGNPSILPAGRNAEPFIVPGITPDGRFRVETSIIEAGTTTPYDLAGFGAFIAPDPKPAGWDDAWLMISAGEPQTVGGLAHLTATAADALYRQTGYRSNDVAAILGRYVETVRRAMLSQVGGRVKWLDTTSQVALAGIELRLVRPDHTIAASTFTFADGTFAFESVPAGTFDWEIAGAFPAADYAPLTVDLGTSVSGIELSLLTGASAHVRVLPVAGVPFGEMNVSLVNEELGFVASAVPDALGHVTLHGLPEAVFTLTALAPGHLPVVRPDLEVLLGTSNDLGVIQFSAGNGSVTGVVTRQDTLAPLVGVRVSVTGVPGASAHTDENGIYRIEGLPPGAATLRAVVPGFATATLTGVTIVGGSETTRDIALVQGATVSGVVTVGGGAGEGGTAVPGTTVELLDGTTVLMSAQSDAMGRYALEDLPAGSFTLQAFNDLRGAATVPVTVPASTAVVANLELVPTTTISGAVRYPGGLPTGRVGMRVAGTIDVPEFTVTNDDGQFVLNGFPAGDYVWSLADGGQRTPFTVAAGGTTTTSLAITVESGEVNGRVVAADGTTPIATVVHLVRGGTIVSSTASSPQGDYHFALVAPGTYDVHPVGLEQLFAPATGVVVKGGSATTAPLLVAGSGTLDVTVTVASTGAAPTGFSLAFLSAIGGPRGEDTQLLGEVGSDGRAQFTALAPGSYRLHAIGIGAASEQTIIQIAAGANQAALSLVSCGYISGRITASDGTGIEGIDIIVYRAGDNVRRWTGHTDSEGAYGIGSLLPGAYLLQVVDQRTTSGADPLVMPSAQAFTIAAGNVLTRDITLTAAAQTISGQIAASDGSFPFRADVSLFNAAGIEVLRRRADAAGAFSIPAPAAGSYTLSLSSLGFVAPEQPVTVGATSVTADINATWVGGASQLNGAGSTLAGKDDPPLRALSVSSLFGWVGECKDAFRELLEEVLQKPEPPQPDYFAPLSLKDPCLSCPAAKAAWDRTARLQMIANNQYSAWHDAWQAQVEQVSAEVGLLGVNLLKLAGAMATAELEMLDIAKTVKEEIPKMGALIAAAAKVPPEPYLQWAVERHDELWQLQDALTGIFYTGIATGAAGQLDPSGGKGPKFLETMGNLFNPSTYTSWDSVYGAAADATGLVKAVADLATLSSKFRDSLGESKFGKVLGALDKFFTYVDPIIQAYKTWQTAMNTSLAVQNSKDLYYRVIDQRNQAYSECIAALADCECVGGEECGCEDPPDPPEPPDDPPKPPRPPHPPGGPNGGGGNGRGDRAHDPNAKYTVGYGDENFIRPDEPLIYTITFENMAEAGLPAQRVIVTDQLDAKLDWSTFELLAFGFNRTSVAVPPGLQRYTTLVEVDTDENPVKCDLRLDPGTGLFTIDLRSVDAVTGGFPRNSLAGFLPPNDAMHRGEGFVTFMLRPKPGLTDLTTIENLASIVFDTNDAILTNETVNTIDARPPEATVAALPGRSGRSFQVSWSAGAAVGSEVLGYTVWVSRDGGPWELWLNDVTATSALFVGEQGVSYRFFATARDAVGWSDAITFAAQATTDVLDSSRLINISTRGRNGTGSEAMILGFVIRPGSNATASKPILIRGVGPTLSAAPFNVPGVLADPRLDLHDRHGEIFGGNDDWSDAANAGQLPGEFSRLYAFNLPVNSADAAVLATMAPGLYTARVSGPAGATGVTLVEAYDADASQSDPSRPQIINFSTRGFVGTNDQVMIAGFVISGTSPKTLLIRAVGQTLAGEPFNVPGVVADPEFRVVNAAGKTIAANDNWGDADPELVAAVGASVYAFPLPAGSSDAALVITLDPGLYTVIVSGKDNTTGVALTELYDADP